jgi:hypothetical protein
MHDHDHDHTHHNLRAAYLHINMRGILTFNLGPHRPRLPRPRPARVRPA